MLRVLRIFLGSPGRTKWTVLASLVVASLAEALGLASLLPALEALLGDPDAEGSVLRDAVYDTLASVGIPPSIEVLLLLVAGGVVLKATMIVLGMMHVGYAVADVATGVRRTLVNSLVAASWAYFTREPVGRFANAMSIDATRSGQAYLLAMMMLASCLQTVVSVTLAFLISWQLALAGLAVGGVIIIVLGPLVRVARKAGRGQQKSTELLVTLLSDTLAGIKGLKAMARQRQFIRMFDKQTGKLRKALRRQAITEHMMKALREPMFVVFMVAGVYVAHSRLTLPIAEMIVMAVLLERIVSAMGRIQTQLQRALVMEASHDAVRTIIAEADAEREQFTGTLAPTLEQGCAFERVWFAFGDHAVLEDVSLTIPANQITVIMGPSGTGKTTLIDLLLGLYRPDRGRILVDGESLDEINLESWRRMVGYVPQELTLFHDTIRANITLSDPAFTDADVVAALETAGAWEFVQASADGMYTPVGERGSKLSGGQRQRISLARALITQPKLLVLDEVTSALDPKTELEICENIRALDGDLTIVAITHRPAWVDVADRAYEMTPSGIRLVTGPDRKLAVVPGSGELA